MTRNGPAGYNYANYYIAIIQTNRELVSLWTDMVPMILIDKLTGIF
ncbi:hypothetical protein EFW59_04167 [Bacillus subtilis]|nr:hypothetical protein EFW59_04167 [Bacillus subtilis]